MGVPQGRNAAAHTRVGRFVEEAKAANLVTTAIKAPGCAGWSSLHLDDAT